MCLFFFFNYTATTQFYTHCHTLSLHDALPFLPAGLEIGLSLELLARPLGDEMHDAARRVPPEQGALRPVQNLDAIDVDELTHEAAGIGDVNFVHIIANGGLARVRTDAADRQIDTAESAVLVADDEARQRFR